MKPFLYTCRNNSAILMDCTREICQLTSIKLQKFTKYQNPTDKHARRLKDIVEHIEQHVIDIYDFVLKHRYI